MAHIKVNVPGTVPFTSTGMVRKSTRKRLVREARKINPAVATYAAVELNYPTSTNYRKETTVTFDPTRDAIYGF